MGTEMVYTIDWDAGAHGVTIRARGASNLAVSLALIAEVADDPRFGPGTKVLLDDTQLDGSATTSGDVQTLVEAIVERSERLRGCACAIVVGSPLDFGLTRMWKEALGERADLHVRVFYDEVAALAWLAAPESSTPPE